MTADIRRLLSYDKTNGEFRWLVDKGTACCGSIAGWIERTGYRYIQINGRPVAAHRLAFFFEFGRWPHGSIDHINGIKGDNRIENLREATHAINAQNVKRAPSHSITGMLGVTRKPSGRYAARIGVAGKHTEYIGTYDTAEEAHQAYLDAKRQLHVGCTI